MREIDDEEMGTRQNVQKLNVLNLKNQWQCSEDEMK